MRSNNSEWWVYKKPEGDKPNCHLQNVIPYLHGVIEDKQESPQYGNIVHQMRLDRLSQKISNFIISITFLFFGQVRVQFSIGKGT
jgi:hypothetical protein